LSPRLGLPQDPAQYAAFFLFLFTLAIGKRLLKPAASDRVFVILSACSAALLSALYIHIYLRGGPRIIDATAYFLEARALAEGHVQIPVSEPVAATLGRFLLRTDTPQGPALAVLFPPGYPAFLALGFLLGAPLLLGPLLAAAITVATYTLARLVVQERPPLVDTISLPRLATILSVLCSTLRYHTADTMSHGLSALCVTAGLGAALASTKSENKETSRRILVVVVGFFIGWLFATRPFSALALAVPLFYSFVISHKPRFSTLLFLLLGATPGIFLLVLHQHAATGEWFSSSQRAYYAVSDGPPGCFRYGFGPSIGCVGEHGDFVEANLPHGYNAYAAIATTLRRLKQHLPDAANSELFVPILLLGTFGMARLKQSRFFVIAIVAQILVYVPFYFDGNYPGGGARFYADILPIEHIVLAYGVLSLAGRFANRRKTENVVAGLLALVPLGFAFRTGFDHAALRDREGGLPMFEPERVQGLPEGALLFVDTDHGFLLGFDPKTNAGHNENKKIRRFRGDALDFLTWTSLGKPPAFRYLFTFSGEPQETANVEIVPFAPVLADPFVMEGENLWPPLRQDHGYALVRYASGTCASAGRWLSLVASPANEQEEPSMVVGLPAPLLGGRFVSPRIAFVGEGGATVELLLDDKPSHTWTLAPDAGASPSAVRCLDLSAEPIPEAIQKVGLVLRRRAGASSAVVALDALTIMRAKKD